MGECPADNQQQHSQRASEQDAQIAMAAKPDGQRKRAQRQHDHQNLGMQVPVRVLPKKRQACDEKRQREAVDQTKGRQRDGGTIEPVGRFRRILIHRALPLCWVDGVLRPPFSGRKGYNITFTEDAMDKRLLAILRCPVTHKGLSLAKRATLNEVNSAIDAGKLMNRDGRVVDEPLAEALVTDDGKVLYPVADGIPVLLESESINMEQLG